MLNASHSSFPELFTLQFMINRAWLQNLSKHPHKATFFKLSSLAVLIIHKRSSILTLCTLRTFLIILPAQQTSGHNNSDAGIVYLRQADATVLSRRGSYFYFSMWAAKAFQNKQTLEKFLPLFFAAPYPLLFGGKALLLFMAGSPPGEMQCQRTAAFRPSPCVYMRSMYSLLLQLESWPDHTNCIFQCIGKQYF